MRRLCGSPIISPCSEEEEQLRERLLRRFLRKEVAAVERAPVDVVRPFAPDLDDVSIQLGELPAAAPEHEDRAGDALRAAVDLVQGAVVRRTGAVVLTHRMDRLRPARTAVVLERFRREELARLVALAE